jgi:hypothetical protein
MFVTGAFGLKEGLTAEAFAGAGRIGRWQGVEPHARTLCWKPCRAKDLGAHCDTAHQLEISELRVGGDVVAREPPTRQVRGRRRQEAQVVRGAVDEDSKSAIVKTDSTFTSATGRQEESTTRPEICGFKGKTKGAA